MDEESVRNGLEQAPKGITVDRGHVISVSVDYLGPLTPGIGAPKETKSRLIAREIKGAHTALPFAEAQ